jgi:hypothetical protein
MRVLVGEDEVKVAGLLNRGSRKRATRAEDHPPKAICLSGQAREADSKALTKTTRHEGLQAWRRDSLGPRPELVFVEPDIRRTRW